MEIQEAFTRGMLVLEMREKGGENRVFACPENRRRPRPPGRLYHALGPNSDHYRSRIQEA
jgi:hypothetical protein